MKAAALFLQHDRVFVCRMRSGCVFLKGNRQYVISRSEHECFALSSAEVAHQLPGGGLPVESVDTVMQASMPWHLLHGEALAVRTSWRG